MSTSQLKSGTKKSILLYGNTCRYERCRFGRYHISVISRFGNLGAI